MTSPIEGQNLSFDHLAIAVGKGNLAALRAFFTQVMGGEIVYDPGIIGDKDTGMRTFVVKLDAVQLAFMEGVDGGAERGFRTTSQISYYEDGSLGVHGPMAVQHIAICCKDIRRFAAVLAEKGVRFLTENDDGSPDFLFSDDEGGGKVIQLFTYPLANGLFLELKEKIPDDPSVSFREFRDKNVRSLWFYVRQKMEKHGVQRFFSLNIFGEFGGLDGSLLRRGYSV